MRVKFDKEKLLAAGYVILAEKDNSVAIGKRDTHLHIILPIKDGYMDLVPERSTVHKMFVSILG